MKITEILACLVALVVIGGVLRILIVDHKYMDGVSYALAAISVGAAIAFVAYTFLLTRSP